MYMHDSAGEQRAQAQSSYVQGTANGRRRDDKYTYVNTIDKMLSQPTSRHVLQGNTPEIFVVQTRMTQFA